MSSDVSVVIPLYNGERFLEATLRSILVQTLQPAEVIVVDDGSRDRGPDIVAGFEGRVTLLKGVANRGVQTARNLGIAHARTSWIAFCDQDDLWAPDHLARHARLAAAAPRLDFIFSNFHVLRDGVLDQQAKFDAAPPGFWDKGGRRVLPEGWILENCIAGQTFLWHPIFPSATLVTKALLEAIGGFDIAMRGLRPEDWEFTLRCLYRAQVGAIPDPLVTIRRHDANFSRDQVLNLVDEVAALQFIKAHHAEARPYHAVIDGEMRRRRRQAFEGAFMQRNHGIARRIASDLPWADHNARLLFKRACITFPDGIGLRLNDLLQRVSGLRGVERGGPSSE